MDSKISAEDLLKSNDLETIQYRRKKLGNFSLAGAGVAVTLFGLGLFYDFTYDYNEIRMIYSGIITSMFTGIGFRGYKKFKKRELELIANEEE